MTTKELTKLSAAELVEKIRTAVADTEVRTFEALEIGQVIQQGDVYLHRVPADWPRGKLLGTRQVAVGTSVGSRHIVVGDGVAVYEGKQLPPSVTVRKAKRGSRQRGFTEADYLGPVTVIPTSEALSHPEHSYHRNESGECMTFQVTYQVDEATGRRVED